MPKLDILATKKEQMEILVPYLEGIVEGKEGGLEITPRTLALVQRILRGWDGLYTGKRGKDPYLTPQGAYLYYKKLEEGNWK